MRITSVCVLGGSGFLGGHLVPQLSARGLEVRVPTRDRERARQLILLPTVDVIQADVHDSLALAKLLRGCDAVINLVAVLHEHGAQSFERVHVELPRKIVAACKQEGVPRLLHVSALKASSQAPSAYLRSKARGEEEIRTTAGDALQITVVRPSVMYGREDHLLNTFAALASRFPLLPLASPRARFQPVHVEDVARALSVSLDDARTFGNNYELCGPQVYTLRELMQFVCDTLGVDRRIIGLGSGLSYLQAAMLEHLPGKLMTRDNHRSMQVDNVCDCPFPDVMGFSPTPMEAVVPTYLAHANPRARYRGFRFRARRNP